MALASNAFARHAWLEPRATKLFPIALSVGLGLCLVYLVTPDSWTVLRQLIVYPSAELIAVLSVLVGVRLYSPTQPNAILLIGLGLFANLIADVTWGIYSVQDRDPFPSIADAFYLAFYPLAAAGLAVAAMRRKRLGVDARAAIDAALVTVVCGLIAWVYLILPVWEDGSRSTTERIVTILYPIGDVLLLAVATRFVMSASWNVRALRMLVLGFALMLIGDTMFALNAHTTIRPNRLWDTFLLAGIVLIGVQALDKSMTALTDDTGDPATSSKRFRLFLLIGAALVPPAILAVQELRGEPLHLAANIVSMILVVLLVAARLQFMTNRLRRSAEREAALNRYSSELLAASGSDEILATARSALTLLAEDGDGTAELVLAADADRDRTAADFATAVTVRGEEVGTIVARATPEHLRRWRTSLTTIATELSIALERDDLLASEHAAAMSLEEQNTRLRELDAMKDRFVSSVSHELRTPLTSMVGYLEMLREDEAGELNPEQSHMLAIVDRNCHRLNRLISDILVMARFDSGRIELQSVDVDLVGLATKELESIAAVAFGQGVDTELLVDAPQLVIKGDEMRLEQLIDNLLSNAVKFTPPGGTVTLTLATSDDRALLTVGDTGVGIPADEIDRIFDRFFRASTVGTTAGTGLGLSIAQSIAEAHGGTIDVTSQVGGGTTFTVVLPLPVDHDDSDAQRTHEVTT